MNEKREKKALRRALVIAIVITISIFTYNKVKENSQEAKLHRLDIDVELLDGGDGIVTMMWDYLDDYGTEHYIPIKRKGIKITDFYVEKNGIPYETIEDWETDKSLEEKAYKAGIVKNSDEIELCWGISEYGKNEYKVSYKVEGMVRSLKDSDMIFYKFVNDYLSEPPKEVKIDIHHAQKQFSLDNTRMWAFGFNGKINIEEGHVVWESTSSLDRENYGTVLLKLEKDFLNSKYVERKSFEDYRVKAFKGSNYSEKDYTEGELTNKEKKKTGTIIWKYIGLGVLCMRLILNLTKLIFGTEGIFRDIKSMRGLGVRAKKYDGQYHRDIPYDGNPEDIYYILNKLKPRKKAHLNYMTYYFLKWIKEGVIVKEAYGGGVVFTKEKLGLKIVKEPENTSKGEEKFFIFLKRASREDNILGEKEFDKWAIKNMRTFNNFVEKLNLDSQKTLKRKGYLNDKSRLTEKGKELTINIIKFKNFLLEFSLLNERDSINVNLWDDLMLYAALIGVTDEVKDEFNKLYPEYFEITKMDVTTVGLASGHSSRVSKYYSSSGYGGSTSMGGGGGSFGGGSGGGTR